VDKQLIGEEDMLQWLSWGDLKGETKSETIAAKDRASQTKYQAKEILQTETANTDSAIEQCIKRHDRVCVQIHFNNTRKYG